MNLDDLMKDSSGKLRIVQELVPGKQITIAHVIANPDKILYQKLGLDPAVDYSKAAIGIESSGVDLGFVDRFSGTLIVTGTVSEVDAALEALIAYSRDVLGFACCPITRT